MSGLHLYLVLGILAARQGTVTGFRGSESVLVNIIVIYTVSAAEVGVTGVSARDVATALYALKAAVLVSMRSDGRRRANLHKSPG